MNRQVLRILLLVLSLPVGVGANPAGLTVQNGSASVVANGNQLNVTASHNAVLNWQSFNINSGETTSFIQPSAASIVWNRINDLNPSQIYGNLNANGVVVLMNQSGFYFGPNSFVSAAGLVISTAPSTPVESSAGLFWQFNGAPPTASIVNYGHLNTGRGGPLFLIGERIENHGTLNAPEGNIGLLAGREVLLSLRPDGRGLSAAVNLPSGSIDNSGQITADAGTIALHAQVVNQNGLVQANSIRERNGIIELLAADTIKLGDSSVISAQGDASSISAGGTITIKSKGIFTDSDQSHINVAGGGLGGDGGHVEISAPFMPDIKSEIDGHARSGSTGGRLFIDPQDIIINFSGTGNAGTGTVGASDPPVAGALTLNANSAFIGFSQIDLQATRNITLSSGTLWDLVAITGVSSPGSLLKLEAGNNITIANGAGILAGDNWAVTLQAGRNFAASDSVVSGIGNIALSGTGSIEARNGDINLLAGNNITVAGGFVRTIAGGNISATALGGSINAGTRANGFIFRPTGYEVSPDLGGISSANGGNVNLSAGLDIISYLPISGGVATDAGSGAFGAQPGNVTITAGRDVSGHFVVRNGVGSITAGRDAGISARLLALSLVSGGWTVNATRDILLQEVRNPNGVFNNLGLTSSTTKHFFDYTPDAYTVLHGGHSVQLRGTALPRNSGDFEQSISPIYPGTLAISAGAGGVILGNDVTLFPSPFGNLTITTTDGGSLTGTKSGDLTQLIVSDSGRSQYKEFGDFGIADHAAVPLHLNDTEPVRLDIAGNMDGILLGVPKRAEINIGGNMKNSRFDGQNLHAGDVTRINVAGDVINRNEFTSVALAAAPNFGVFDLVYPPLSGDVAGVQNQFFYNAANQSLTFQGRMTGNQLAALLNLRVRTFDKFGAPILDANNEPVTAPALFADVAALTKLYNDSQDVPLNPDTGYRIGGGGQFNFTAHNLDLGATVGIVSQGPRGNAALANYFTHGADINVALSGDLDMFSTKIASLNGGNITVFSQGDVRVGSRDFSASDATARGIFTTDPSDVTVVARGNIDVNGSRIAAYDGGDITVRSLEGNIDAGTGGRGSAVVEKIYVDPVTRQILTYAPRIPGSGILATSFPQSRDAAFPRSHTLPGNILIDSPQGNIIASGGGIVQLSLNGVKAAAGQSLSVTLNAGTKLPNGDVLYPGSVDASGSAVIAAGTLDAKASVDVIGFFLGRRVKLSAVRNVSAVALGQDVSASAGENLTGVFVGTESVNATAASIDAALLSQNVSASGDASGAQLGFSQGTAANSTSQSQQNEDQAKTVASNTKSDGDEELKKKVAGPRLAKTSGRVTVILPSK